MYSLTTQAMNKEKQNAVPVPLRLRPDVLNMIAEISDSFGHESVAETIRYCVKQTHKAEFPAYIQQKKNRTEKAELSPEERAKKRAEQKALEQKVERELHESQGQAICDALGGKTLTMANGNKSCEYTSYDYVNPHIIHQGVNETPFELLGDFEVKNQFRGASKQVIMEALKNKKSLN